MLQTTNKLIEGLEEVRHSLRPYAARVVVPSGATIYTPGQEIDRVFLVEDGIAALAWPDGPAALDVAMIGQEGMLGSGASFGGPTALFQVIARSPLTLVQMPTGAFDAAVNQSPELKARIFQFAANLVRQIAETARANARLSIEQRLARWIAMAASRLDGADLTFTHDGLAASIGCRRAGVTVGLHCLEGDKLIRSTRGKVRVLNLERLARFGSGHQKAGISPDLVN